MTQHTPGPWSVEPRDPAMADVVSEAYGTIASVADYPHNARRVMPGAVPRAGTIGKFEQMSPGSSGA